MLLSKNIYLSDDDPDDIEIFQVALDEICTNCSLTVSYDGCELLQQLTTESNHPDVIFLDINMPKMSGFEALKNIRKNGFTTPVVMYSTSFNERHIENAHNLGANLYLVKPSDYLALKKFISNILSINWDERPIPAHLSKFVVKMEGI